MKKYSFCLAAITLLALGVRFYNLTYHSLWFDEAISVYWARQSVPRIVEVGLTLVEDRLPPLYYLALKGWTALFGFSEAGVRSLSVVQGALLVPVLAGLAATLFNRRVAALTALLAAFNPFLIWYSQEARMYAQAVLLGTLTVWAGLKVSERISESANQRIAVERILHPPSSILYPLSSILYPPSSILHALLFTLFAIAGLYTHLYTGFLLPAFGLWLLLSSRLNRRAWLLFGLSGLAIGLAFAPLAVATWRFSGEATPGDPLHGAGLRAWQLLQAFTTWKAPLPPALQVGIPLVVTLAALGAYLPRTTAGKRPPTLPAVGQAADTLRIAPYAPRTTHHVPGTMFHAPHPTLLTTLLLLAPFAIASLLLYRNYLAFFGERYFIGMVPWLLLLAGVGAVNWSLLLHEYTWRKVPGTFFHSPFAHLCPPGYSLTRSLLPLLLLTATLLAIPGQWSVPAAKEAWRQSVAYLAERATADSGILIHPDWVRYPFQFYFRGPGQTYAAFSTVTPATSLDGPLQGVVGTHPVIWLVQSHLDGPDPEHRVEQWFASRYPLVTEAYPPGISLKAYAPGYQLTALPAEATPVAVDFDNGLRLVGYDGDRLASARDELFHPPSGWVHVTLYWTAARPVTAEAAPFVNLVGPEGVWGASLDRPDDALKLYPPPRWPAGLIVRQDLDVNLNPATPPGRYSLVVGLQGQPAQYPLAEVEIR